MEAGMALSVTEKAKLTRRKPIHTPPSGESGGEGTSEVGFLSEITYGVGRGNQKGSL